MLESGWQSCDQGPGKAGGLRSGISHALVINGFSLNCRGSLAPDSKNDQFGWWISGTWLIICSSREWGGELFAFFTLVFGGLARPWPE